VVMVIIAILNNPSIHRKVSWQQIYRRLSCWTKNVRLQNGSITTKWWRYPAITFVFKHCYWQVIWTASRTPLPLAGPVYSLTASARWSPCQCPTSQRSRCYVQIVNRFWYTIKRRPAPDCILRYGQMGQFLLCYEKY
jgi:hypothetical protein